jgi:DNA-binding FrmR family transcriptional regulator
METDMAPATKTKRRQDSAVDEALGRIECGCAMPGDESGGRKAVAVDPDAKERNVKRLRRIEGQVRGLQRMVDEDRYCADIMTQISSVHEALRSVGRELMRNHLKHCATSAIRAGPVEAESMYDELVDLLYKHSR